MSAPVEEWDSYIFGNTGLAGHSDKINEGAVFGHDGHHLCVSDGFLKTNWQQIHNIGQIIDGKVTKLVVESENKKCIYELNAGDDCAELELCRCSNDFCRLRVKNSENGKSEDSDTEGLTFWLSGYQFELKKMMDPVEAGLRIHSSVELLNNSGKILQAVQVTKKEVKIQLCMMKTRKVFLVALAGGTEATDCDLYIPTMAIKEIGGYLVRNGS